MTNPVKLAGLIVDSLARARARGLNLTQTGILLHLAANPRYWSPLEIAAATALSYSGVNRNADDLVSAGLVCRTPGIRRNLGSVKGRHPVGFATTAAGAELAAAIVSPFRPVSPALQIRDGSKPVQIIRNPQPTMTHKA